MKSLFRLGMIAAIIIFASQANGQLRKIPAEVTDAFREMFPQATEVEWRDRLSGFTAGFTLDSISYLASFDNKGEWESTEYAIEQEDLPGLVSDGFEKSKYADWTVKETTKIELPNDAVHYKIAVAKSDLNKRNLIFNEEGRLLKDKITL